MQWLLNSGLVVFSFFRLNDFCSAFCLVGSHHEVRSIKMCFFVTSKSIHTTKFSTHKYTKKKIIIRRWSKLPVFFWKVHFLLAAMDLSKAFSVKNTHAHFALLNFFVAIAQTKTSKWFSAHTLRSQNTYVSCFSIQSVSTHLTNPVRLDVFS